jgi:hypothetical protein
MATAGNSGNAPLAPDGRAREHAATGRYYPRMGKPPDEPTGPMTLGNMRSLGPRIRCTKCGQLGATVRPDWTRLRGGQGRRGNNLSVGPAELIWNSDQPF